MGLNAAIFAQLAGALRVFVVGAPRARLEAAKRLGVEDTLDITAVTSPQERIAWVRDRSAGRGADVVIEASGNPSAVPEGLEMLRDAGRYVVVGHYTDAGEVALNPHRHLNRKHATVLGCWGYEFSHLHRSLAMMARHRARFGWAELVTREYPLSRPAGALEDMERLAVVKALIRPTPETEGRAAQETPSPAGEGRVTATFRRSSAEPLRVRHVHAERERDQAKTDDGQRRQHAGEPLRSPTKCAPR